MEVDNSSRVLEDKRSLNFKPKDWHEKLKTHKLTESKRKWIIVHELLWAKEIENLSET